MGTGIKNCREFEDDYCAPRTNIPQIPGDRGFFADGVNHFNVGPRRAFCESWACKPHIVSAYSPWINGLVEGTNKILLHVLKRLCAPGLGDDEYDNMDWDSLPKSWPLHLDEAVLALNTRILPNLKFSPKELLLATVVNTPRTPLANRGSFF